MNSTYAVKYEPSRPVGNFRDTVTLARKWALVTLGKSYGYTAVSRFGTKEAAERAMAARCAA